MEDKIEIATACAAQIRTYLLSIHSTHGVPVDALLAGAHAQVTSMMAVTIGAEATAEELRRVADQIEAMPSREEVALAMAAPAGKA